MKGHTFLAKVNALECDPGSELVRFMLVTFSDDYSGVIRTTNPVDEKEMRSVLREIGMPDEGPDGIGSRMERAPFLY